MQAVQGGAGGARARSPAASSWAWTGQSWPLYLDALSFALGALRHHLAAPRPAPLAATPPSSASSPTKMMAGRPLVWDDEPAAARSSSRSLVFMLALGMVNVAEVFFVTVTLHALGHLLRPGRRELRRSDRSWGRSLARRARTRARCSLARSILVAIAVVGVMIGAGGTGHPRRVRLPAAWSSRASPSASPTSPSSRSSPCAPPSCCAVGCSPRSGPSSRAARSAPPPSAGWC